MRSPRWSPSPGQVVALVSLPIFIGALDLTVISAVLPQVIFDLEIPIQTGLDDAAWLVTGYLLAYSVAMTFMGRLSDLRGRRRVYLTALSAFALGSYLVAVGDTWPTRMALRAAHLLSLGRPDPSQVSLYLLILARMVQAFGAGAMVPVGMALVGDLYPPGERAWPLGVIAAVDTAGWVVGHLYGGIVVRFFDWRLIFWFNLPLCLVAFTLIWASLRGLPRPDAEGQMDWGGAILIALSLTALNLGLGAGAEVLTPLARSNQPALPSRMAPLTLTAVVLLVAFVWRQSRARSPLLPLHLFRQPNFTSASLTNFLVGFCLFVAIANVPLFINTLLASSLEQAAWDSGWMLSAFTLPMALAAFPGGWLTVRLGYRWPGLLGLLGGLVGFGLMSGWGKDVTYARMAPHLILAGIGFGFTIAPIAAAAVNAVSDGYRGIASALVILFRLVGMTVAVSSLTTYGLHRTNVLTAQLLSPSLSLAEVVDVAMTVAARVIDETFLIGLVVCGLAIFPVLRLKLKTQERTVDHG